MKYMNALETPGNNPAAALLNLESIGSIALSEGTRPALFATRLIVVGMVGCRTPRRNLGRWGYGAVAVSSASGARYCAEWDC